MNLCPICNRELIPGKSIDEHHLIPKTFKGNETIIIHKVCHNKIHHTFSERELLHYYHTIERLVSHEEMAKFIKWLKNKDPEFFDNSKDTKNRKKKR